MLVQVTPASGFSQSAIIAKSSNLSDEELFRELQQSGRAEFFEQIFHRHYQMLCQLAYGLTHCRYKSEEIVSDVLVKIWHNRTQLNIETKIRYYLHVAVRNKCIDHLRKQIRERDYRKKLDRDYRSNYVMPDDQVIGEEFSQHVEAAIEALPPQGRHIFRLSRDEGLKYREIAELLGISIKTVETHMRRSLIYLRSRLGQSH